MKKTLAFILAVLMLVTALTACGETKENDDPSDPTTQASADATGPDPEADLAEETESVYLEDGLGNPDFDGYDFRILSCFFNDRDTWRYVLCDEMTGTPLDDQLYDTKEYLENRFNISFTMLEPGGDDTAQSAFQQSVTSGDDSFDMHIGKDWRTCDLGIKGYAYNLFDID